MFSPLKSGVAELGINPFSSCKSSADIRHCFARSGEIQRIEYAHIAVQNGDIFSPLRRDGVHHIPLKLPSAE